MPPFPPSSTAPTVRDEAILLRRFPYSESSLVVRVFTPQHGKIGLMARGAFMVLLLTQLYLGWHVLFAAIAPHSSPVGLLQTVAIILCFSGLYGLQFWLQKYPDGKLATTLYPWAYHGFYLDELFTRVTFQVWPVKLKPAQAQTRVHRFASDNGEPA